MPPVLDKARRLTRPAEYRRVYDEGVKLVGRYLILFHASPSGERGRVGMAVSSKVGGAVERNRQKRRIREALALELVDAPSREMVFVALARIKDAGFEELRLDMRGLIRRVRG